VGEKRGYILAEVLLALALAAVTIPAVIQGLSVALTAADRAQDRLTLHNLARSQLEDVLAQPYDPLPASYPILSPVPPEYTVQVEVTVPTQYSYPGGSSAPETVQLITVRVNGPFGSVELQGYKVRE